MGRTPLPWLAFVAAASLSIGCTVRTVPAPIDAAVTHPDATFADVGRDSGPPDASLYDVPPPDNTCASFRIGTQRIIPRVVLVIDQSGSMALDFGGMSRWHTLEDALVGTDGLVTRLDADVRFGAIMYTDDPDWLGCPDVATQPVTLPSVGNIRSLYVNTPAGNTPTGDSIAYVVAQRATLFDEAATTGPEIMLLATDGEPGTCADGADIVGGRALSVSSTADAFAAGIRTYVLSVGTEVANAHLQDVANAGVGHTAGTADAPYWVATDATELRTALASIASGALPCTVELMGRIDPARACEGTVTLGPDALACGTDWHAIDETHIGLSDSTCARLRSTTDDLVGMFPCDVVVF